jgi:hypothetical protein
MKTGDFPLHIADTARHLAEWQRRRLGTMTTISGSIAICGGSWACWIREARHAWTRQWTAEENT